MSELTPQRAMILDCNAADSEENGVEITEGKGSYPEGRIRDLEEMLLAESEQLQTQKEIVVEYSKQLKTSSKRIDDLEGMLQSEREMVCLMKEALKSREDASNLILMKAINCVTALLCNLDNLDCFDVSPNDMCCAVADVHGLDVDKANIFPAVKAFYLEVAEDLLTEDAP